MFLLLAYRETFGIYKLILCHVLLKLFISVSFLMKTLRFLMHIKSSANGEYLTSFPIHILLISSCCHIDFYTSSNSMLKLNGDSEQNSFFPDFRGIASSCFPPRITLARCLLYIAFILRCVFSSPTISRYVGCDQMFLLQLFRWSSNFSL